MRQGGTTSTACSKGSIMRTALSPDISPPPTASVLPGDCRPCKRPSQRCSAANRLSTVGQLWLLPADVYGKADLLVRCDDHPSDLGNYHYRVKEIKNSSTVKPYQKLPGGRLHTGSSAHCKDSSPTPSTLCCVKEWLRRQFITNLSPPELHRATLPAGGRSAIDK